MEPVVLILIVTVLLLMAWIIPVIGTAAGNSLKILSYVLPRRARKFYK